MSLVGSVFSNNILLSQFLYLWNGDYSTYLLKLRVYLGVEVQFQINFVSFVIGKVGVTLSPLNAGGEAIPILANDLCPQL